MLIGTSLLAADLGGGGDGDIQDLSGVLEQPCLRALPRMPLPAIRSTSPWLAVVARDTTQNILRWYSVEGV